MKKAAEAALARWRESASLRAKAGTWGGFAATVAFALYNGALGLRNASLWNGSICAYYILLSALRGSLLAAERRSGRLDGAAAARLEKRAFAGTAAAMLVMNGALAVPVALMVLDRRPAQMGLIPAITSATYTTYKISAAAVKLRRRKESVFAGELGIIRFVDALVSVLVLQNTLICAVEGGVSQGMFYLAAVSSAGIFLAITAVLVAWIVRNRPRDT